MITRGFFLTLEGTDGVGKSTQARLLVEWLTEQGIETVLTREPGGSGFAERIREILLDPQVKIDPLTELLLYESARAEHVAKLIRPEIEKGKLVVCDRFTDATLAYQGGARKLSFQTITILNSIASQGVKPDLTILLDLDPVKAFKRAEARNRKRMDRLEQEGTSFQHQVRQAYLSLAKEDPQRISIVNVQKEINETQRLLRDLVRQRYEYHRSRPHHSISH